MGSKSRSVEIRMHDGAVVGVNAKGDPLANAQFLLTVAQKSNDSQVVDAARAVLAQVTDLIQRQVDVSLPGDLDLLAGYKKLRSDYLVLKKAFGDMCASNEAYRATVVEMGAAMTAKGLPTPTAYLRAVSENTELPNAVASDDVWPDSLTTGDNAKQS